MRKVIITQTSYLIPSRELAAQPGVRKHWQLPLGCTLIEIDDPIFKDPDTLYPESGPRAAAIVDEAKLFAPYYQKPRSLADLLALKVSAHTTWYHLITSSRTVLKWPKLLLGKDWDATQQIQVTYHLPPKTNTNFRALEGAVEQWQCCMRRLGILESYNRDVDRTPRTCITTLHFHNSAADAAMALFMLLSVSLTQSAITSVSLSLPSDRPVLDSGELHEAHEEREVSRAR